MSGMLRLPGVALGQDLPHVSIGFVPVHDPAAVIRIDLHGYRSVWRQKGPTPDSREHRGWRPAAPPQLSGLGMALSRGRVGSSSRAPVSRTAASCYAGISASTSCASS